MDQSVATEPGITPEELQLAARNHGLPLEALRYDITPAGLHYLLIHFDIPHVDVQGWSLQIDGLVEHPMELTLDEIRRRPSVTQTVTLECAGNGRARLEPRPLSQPWLVEAVGNAEWTGTPLAPILEEAGLAGEAIEAVFTGLDRGVQGDIEQAYQRSLPLGEAMRPEVILAYQMNGQPLLPQHGFPLRLVVPGWYGMTHVKWLRSINLVAEPFQGYQQAEAYRIVESEDDPGTPVSRILPRSLMIPPGIPDFFSRRRRVRQRTVELRGRAWSGWGAISRVEVTADGGITWADAILDEPASPHGWRGWTYQWEAEPGDHRLGSRAHDESGNLQPLEQPWNLQGMANNMVQWVDTEVV